MMEKTREQWLEQATRMLRPRFKKAGFPIPEKVRVSCGWPHQNGAARKNRRIGECWGPKASVDKITQVFISPTLDDHDGDGVALVGTLAHELVHAAVGVDKGHKGDFVRCGKAVGLEGKPTSMGAGSDLAVEAGKIVAKLGRYPHGRMTPTQRDKVQTTRLLKVQCSDCGYIARVTRKWLDEAGAPLCPCSGEPMVEEV
jgi:hypothetical protein